jgi:UDPglucose 6-dehydrogenase
VTRCAVIGLGKLGSCLAAVLAAAGHEVVGVDNNPAIVDAVNAGRAPVVENDLQETIDRSKGRLRATSDYADAVSATDLAFVIVPTPSGTDKMFVNDFVIAAVEEIGEALRADAHPYVVNITSTVMPGSTGGPIREALERAAGRSLGDDLGLCYSPEFIALGSVVRDLQHPDLILVGESDARSGELVASVTSSICNTTPAIRRMTWPNAELAKIAINTFVTTKISYANMLAEMCERIPGGDIDVVTGAVGSDSRIGSSYMRGATGYGGPCFPRDNVALSRLASTLGIDASLADATDSINIRQPQRLAERIREVAPAGASVTVLGLAYKPETPVADESQGAALARRLADLGFDVTVHDPLAHIPESVLGSDVAVAETMGDAIAKAEVIAVMTPWAEYLDLVARVEAGDRPVWILDCWRALGSPSEASRARIINLGRHEVTDAAGTGASTTRR